MRKLMGEQMKQRRAITQRYLDKLPEAERRPCRRIWTPVGKRLTRACAPCSPEQQKAFDEGLKKMEEKRAERAEFLAEGRARSEELIRRSI